MAENFGIFIGTPPAKQLQVTYREQGAHLLTTLKALYAAHLNGADEVPAGLDVENVNGMPVLDEPLMRAGLRELGAELLADEDEGTWTHGTVAYDFLLCRGEDARLRMVDGTVSYLTPTGVKSRDVRAVFMGLFELAEVAGARFWQTAGGLLPEPLDLGDVEGWIREMSDDFL